MDFTHLETLKENILEELKADSTIDKVEKLKLIRDNSLMKNSPWIVHPFIKYENELKEEAKISQPDKHGIYITDCIITDRIGDGWFDRGQTVSYYEIARMLKDNAEDDKVAVAMLRASGGTGAYSMKKEIPLQEAIDCIYDFAIDTNKAGFKVDW